jgi:hypothetical protein
VAGLRDVLWYIAEEAIVAIELEPDEAVVLKLPVPIVEVAVEVEETVGPDVLIDTVTEDEDDAVEEVIIMEGEPIICEDLVIIEEVIAEEELNIGEELVMGEDTGDTALEDNTEEAAEVVVHEVTPDGAVLVLTRLDVAAVDDIVELVARRVDEDCAIKLLVGELATRIPATKLWSPEVNEADASLK